MKIGILLTDHVIDKLIPKHGDQDSFYYLVNMILKLNVYFLSQML